MHTSFWQSTRNFALLASAIATLALLFATRQLISKSDADESSDSPGGFAVVELFTSQGCSSCPSADKNLMSIAERAEANGLSVYTLSFHVDYWNYLGWSDPYSSAAATRRQRLYAKVMGGDRVYTPQMFVNGTTEFVGSNQALSNKAIKSALESTTQAKLTATAHDQNGEVQVNWQASGTQAGDLIVAALVQNQAQQSVSAGENTGRTLNHANVVRDIKVAPIAAGETSLAFTLPSDLKANDYQVIAFIQAADDAQIRAATRALPRK